MLCTILIIRGRLGYGFFLQNRRTRITSATENEKKSKVYRHLATEKVLLHEYILPAHPSISLILNVPRTDDAVGISFVGTENS